MKDSAHLYEQKSRAALTSAAAGGMDRGYWLAAAQVYATLAAAAAHAEAQERLDAELAQTVAAGEVAH